MLGLFLLVRCRNISNVELCSWNTFSIPASIARTSSRASWKMINLIFGKSFLKSPPGDNCSSSQSHSGPPLIAKTRTCFLGCLFAKVSKACQTRPFHTHFHLGCGVNAKNQYNVLSKLRKNRPNDLFREALGFSWSDAAQTPLF